jgi:predicted Fe-Mo cluster-binding NifX family protein
MRLCIPTLDERGLDGRLSAHLGSAPYFTLIHTHSGEVRVLANLYGEHETGNCRIADALQEFGVEAVLCRGLGRRAFGRLREMGVQVYISEDDDAAAALHAFRRGRLRRLTADAVCHGGQRHEVA